MADGGFEVFKKPFSLVEIYFAVGAIGQVCLGGDSNPRREATEVVPGNAEREAGVFVIGFEACIAVHMEAGSGAGSLEVEKGWSFGGGAFGFQACEIDGEILALEGAGGCVV